MERKRFSAENIEIRLTLQSLSSGEMRSRRRDHLDWVIYMDRKGEWKSVQIDGKTERKWRMTEISLRDDCHRESD